jgi:hypothetical protein
MGLRSEIETPRSHASLDRQTTHASALPALSLSPILADIRSLPVRFRPPVDFLVRRIPKTKA